MAAIASLIIMGLGVVMVLTGMYLAVRDHNAKLRQAGGDEALALDKSISALAKLAKALEGYHLGLQLIFLGIVVILLGGMIGGIAAL